MRSTPTCSKPSTRSRCPATTTWPTRSPRTEALRERSRGLVNLVAERRRGFDRELAAVADEGVVETLVAEAAQLRAQLAATESDFDALAPTRAEVDAADARVAALDTISVADAEAAYQRAAQELEQVVAASTAFAREAAQVEAALARVAAARAELEPARRAAEQAEAEAALVRADVAEHASVAVELTNEAREVRVAEEAVREADTAHRHAETDASHWRARAEMLALALEEAHAAVGDEAIAGIDGVVGPLVDVLDVETGCEIAVAAALGDALKAVVVESDDAARALVEECKRGDHHAWLLVAEGRSSGLQISFAPEGARPLGTCVRGLRPGLDPVLARLFAPFVLVDGGWERALDIAIANPGVIAVTRDGDRFGGASPWRAGPPGSSVVTAAALDDAQTRAAEAEVARDGAAAEVELARQRLAAARRAELLAAEEERRRRAELEALTARAAQLRRDLDVQTATLDAQQVALAARADELAAEIADTPARTERARASVAAAEEARATARAHRTEFERLRTQANSLRRDYELRGAAVEERRSVLTRAAHRDRSAARSPTRRGGRSPRPPRRCGSSTRRDRDDRGRPRRARPRDRAARGTTARAPSPPIRGCARGRTPPRQLARGSRRGRAIAR